MRLQTKIGQRFAVHKACSGGSSPLQTSYSPGHVPPVLRGGSLLFGMAITSQHLSNKQFVDKEKCHQGNISAAFKTGVGYFLFAFLDMIWQLQAKRRAGMMWPAPPWEERSQSRRQAVLSVSPCSWHTGGNNPALTGQQITGIIQAFSVSTLVHAKKNK